MLRTTFMLRAALPIAALMAIGCGDDPVATPPADSGARDVPAVDRPTVMDNGPTQDTPPTTDTPTPTDTEPTDTPTPTDTEPTDTTPVDTGPPADAGCTGDGACPAGMVCMAGACVMGCNDMHACPTGQSCCSNACVDTQTTLAHCGGCGMACTAPSGTPTCTAGRCTVTGCAGTMADCDMMASTGCETNTATTAAHCGMCGHACATRANATTTCAMGACGFTCSEGFADCDMMADNGCETDVRTSTGNCGHCGTVCTFANAAATCATGTCGFTCSTGFGNCDSMAANGCETNTQTTVAHCGGCGMACTTPNATAACTAGACGVGTCNDGFGNCDMMVANGCEINLRTDTANCGACGRACGAGQSCAAGTCQYGNGSGGALTVAGTQTINQIRASVNGMAGMTTIALGNVVGTFAMGQSVLFHQTQAATGAVGQYEYNRITAVSGTMATLERPLTNAYVTDTNNHAQVVVVPEYTTVTVPADGTLQAPAWDGNSGGILVFDAGGAVTVAGAIDMSERGFRGNRRVCGTTPIAHCARGIQGESERGRGAANVVANSSGGGGGGSGQDCNAGGGGGHGTIGAEGSTGTGGGVCYENLRGDGGVSVGTPSLASTILFGGAGGEGGLDEDGGYPGGGGHGGGIILVRATTYSVTGAVSSRGGTGQNGNNACFGGGTGMGGGGGGAGGAIRVVAIASATLGAGRLTVGNGDGGSCSTGNSWPAGNGAVGRIGIRSPAVTGTTTPAFNREL